MIKNVLLVDDDANLRAVTQMCLEEVGKFHVTTASNGLEALKIVADHSFDVILLDVMMPGIDGPTTFARMQQEVTNIPPVILLTAKIQRHEMNEYANLGAAGVITKPFNPLGLVAEVHKLVEKFKAAVTDGNAKTSVGASE